MSQTLFLKDNKLFIQLKEGDFEVSNPEMIGGFYNQDETFIFKELSHDDKLMFFGPGETIEWSGGVSFMHQIMGNMDAKKWENTHELMYSKFPYDRRRIVARLIPEESESAYKEFETVGIVTSLDPKTTVTMKTVESSKSQENRFNQALGEIPQDIKDQVEFEHNSINEAWELWGSIAKKDNVNPHAFVFGYVEAKKKYVVSAPSESQHLDKLVALREFIESKINRFVYWDEENKKWFESDQKAASESQEEMWHSWEEGAILGKEVDVMLYDGSVLNNCIPQADGDFYYKPFVRFIDIAAVKQWKYSFENLYD